MLIYHVSRKIETNKFRSIQWRQMIQMQWGQLSIVKYVNLFKLKPTFGQNLNPNISQVNLFYLSTKTLRSRSDFNIGICYLVIQ